MPACANRHRQKVLTIKMVTMRIRLEIIKELKAFTMHDMNIAMIMSCIAMHSN